MQTSPIHTGAIETPPPPPRQGPPYSDDFAGLVRETLGDDGTAPHDPEIAREPQRAPAEGRENPRDDRHASRADRPGRADSEEADTAETATASASTDAGSSAPQPVAVASTSPGTAAGADVAPAAIPGIGKARSATATANGAKIAPPPTGSATAEGAAQPTIAGTVPAPETALPVTAPDGAAKAAPAVPAVPGTPGGGVKAAATPSSNASEAALEATAAAPTRPARTASGSAADALSSKDGTAGPAPQAGTSQPAAGTGSEQAAGQTAQDGTEPPGKSAQPATAKAADSTTAKAADPTAAKVADPVLQSLGQQAPRTATDGDAVMSQQTPQTAAGHATSPATAFGSELRAAADSAAGQGAATRMPMMPVPEQLAVRISRAVQEGSDRFTIQMKPAELGRVSVRLEVGHDQRVIAVISADRADTLDLLQRDARTLERALQQAGLSTDSGSLSFEARGEGGTDNPFGHGDSPGRLLAMPGETGELPAGAPVYQTWRLGADSIDIRI